jgi:DNA-binding transcriptional LysR family regulator
MIRSISTANAGWIDLNLLRVFREIYDQRSVSLAAGRLGVSQPAVSHSLRKLRDLLQDELFVRSGLGLTPTPRAETLATAVVTILDLIERDVRPLTAFDPAQARREFALAMGDLAEVVFLPSLMKYIREFAPDCRIHTRRLPNDVMVTDLEAGAVELVIGHVPEMPGHIYGQTIFTHDYAVIADRDHPRLQDGPLTWPAYEREEHIGVSSGSELHLRAALAERGVTRRLASTVGGFLSVPALIEGTELIATVPTRLSQERRVAEGLRAFALPEPISGYSLQSFWHPRSHSDAGHRWLREALFLLMSRYPSSLPRSGSNPEREPDPAERMPGAPVG